MCAIVVKDLSDAVMIHLSMQVQSDIICALPGGGPLLMSLIQQMVCERRLQRGESNVLPSSHFYWAALFSFIAKTHRRTTPQTTNFPSTGE